MDFNNKIKTDTSGSGGGYQYYYLEDVYQGFKERLLKEQNKIIFQKLNELIDAVNAIKDEIK